MRAHPLARARRSTDARSTLARRYDARGFVIAGSYCEGALFAYEKMHAAWSPRTTADVTASSLAALEILDPTPDLVIIGTGRTVRALSEETLRYLRELGVSAEVSDTANATSTFNVLVEEGRSVAAALLPASA